VFSSTGNNTRAVSDISPSNASPMVGSWCDCSFLLFSQVWDVTISGTEIQPGGWPSFCRRAKMISWRINPSILTANAS
jgi:hypothetical protein